MVCQAMQGRPLKVCWPWSAAPVGVAAGACCSRTQVSNWSCGTATTANFILACESAQNSAHCPEYRPGPFALNHIVFSGCFGLLDGITSVLPARFGTQK